MVEKFLHCTFYCRDPKRWTTHTSESRSSEDLIIKQGQAQEIPMVGENVCRLFLPLLDCCLEHWAHHISANRVQMKPKHLTTENNIRSR